MFCFWVFWCGNAILLLHKGTVESVWSFQSPSPPQWSAPGAPEWQPAGPLCMGRWGDFFWPPAWTASSALPGTELGSPGPDTHKWSKGQIKTRLHHLFFYLITTQKKKPDLLCQGSFHCDGSADKVNHLVLFQDQLVLLLLMPPALLSLPLGAKA